MRKIYTLLMYLALPLVLLFLAWRGLKDRDYARRWAQRFGRFPRPARTGGIVIHAASFGEVNAAAPLVSALLQRMPELPLTVTTFTPTGSRRVRALFGERVQHVYAPLDLPGGVRRFFQRQQPRLLIVMETEIWPNLYAEAARLGVPIMLSNARLSEKSMRGYRRAEALVRDTLSRVAWIGAQSDDDAGRLILCGAQVGRTETAGNLKFDLPVPLTLAGEGLALRMQWGDHRPVLTAGSTRPGDEEVILPAFREILKSRPDALLILVPRHPERFEEAARKARAAGFKVALRSHSETCAEDTECFVIDTMGELMRYYACADVTFVGGTFAPVGGHNLLEPAALGKPVLFGPHIGNTEDAARKLVESGGGLKLESGEQLTAAVLHLFGEAKAQKQAGEAAQQVVTEGRGALEKNLSIVRRFLAHS